MASALANRAVGGPTREPRRRFDLLVADPVDGLQGGVQREGDAGEHRGRLSTVLMATIPPPFNAGLRAVPKATRPATFTAMAANWPTWTPFQQPLRRSG